MFLSFCRRKKGGCVKGDVETLSNMPVAMPGAALIIIAALLGSVGTEKPEEFIKTGKVIILRKQH